MRGCPAKCSPADFIMAAKMQKPSDFARSAMEVRVQQCATLILRFIA